MAITCNKCNHGNPDDSLFCNKCGSRIVDEKSDRVTINENDVNAQTKLFVNRFAESIKDVATQTKHEALEDFQERATKWVRYQFIAVTTAASIVIAIFAYVGFNGFDLSQMLNESKDAVKDAKKEIESVKETTLAKIDEAIKKSEAIKNDIEEINLIKNDIKQEKIRLSKLKNSLQKEIENDIKTVKDDLKNQIKTIQKIERSRYQILVHRGTADLRKKREQTINDLKTALHNTGYVIGPDNLFNVTADRQEIIYYSNSEEMASKAEEIKNALKDKYKNIETRPIESGNNDPFQVVIKLCSNGVVDSGATDNNICKSN